MSTPSGSKLAAGLRLVLFQCFNPLIVENLNIWLINTHECVYFILMKSGDIISALREDGWYEVATKGSHTQFKHPTKPGRVTVPHPKKDIPIGTLKSIEKQAGLKLR